MTLLALAAEGGHALQQFIVQAIAFFLLAAVLVKFVKPALGKILGDRTQGIVKIFEDLERETTEAARQLAEIRQKLAGIEEESQRRIQKSVDEANRTRERALADATQQARAETEKAKREIQIERDKAVLELRQSTVRLTLDAAEHLVQSAMNDAMHGKMADKYVAALDSVKSS